MKRSDVVFKYLKRKRKYVRAIILCRNLQIPHTELPTIDNFNGIGSFGPVDDSPMKRSFQFTRYAKRNMYSADFIAFFILKNRPYCFKQRPLRNGKWPPKTILLR